MEKLNLKRESLYVIEVNDKGDTIEIDSQDIEFPLKVEKALESMRKIENDLKRKEFIINKKEDVVLKDKFMTQNQKERALVIREHYKEMRKVIDELLGEGACQKIFGDINYLTMFNDLFEALKPHFEKIGINQKKISESIIAKYGNKEEDELS